MRNFLFIPTVLAILLFATIPSEAKRWKIISLLEICQNQESVQGRFNETALAIHYGIMHGLNENFVENVDYNYEMYDICNDTNKLTKLLLKLIVDKSYRREPEDLIASNDQEIVPFDSSNILCIMLYLSKERTMLAANILSSAELPVVSFKNFSLSSTKVHNKLFLENSELRQVTNQYMLEFLHEYQYDFLVVFSLNRSYGTHKRYEDFVKLAQTQVCLIHDTVTLEEAVNRTLAISDKRAYVFLIFGDMEDVTYFILDLVEAVPEVDLPLFYPIYEIERKGPIHAAATKDLLNLLKKKNQTSHKNIIPGKFDHSHVLLSFDTYFSEIKGVKSEYGRTKPSDILDVFRRPNYVNRSDKSNCTDFKCKPGFERHLVKDSFTPWGERFVYKCIQCPLDYYKSGISTERCAPCVGKNISNPDRSSCFVPYKLQGFDFSYPSSIIGLTVNLIGLSASVLTIFLFELYKKTPIVRASDRTLSQLQLAFSFLLYNFLLVQALLRPSAESCVLIPSFIGISFSTLVAVTLAKVEKPLLVFRNRKQLTQKDINTTIAHQYFMISLVAVTSILLAAVQYKYKPAYVKTTYNNDTLEKTVTCSNDGHLHIQIIFIILLSLFTLIQAYRSRKLPDSYSESMVILYSSFSAAVFLSILFPLYHSQTSHIDQFNVQWILLSAVGLILLISMYAHKLYTMIFCPEKNTMKAWNRRRIQYSMDESTGFTVPLTIIDSDTV